MFCFSTRVQTVNTPFAHSTKKNTDNTIATYSPAKTEVNPTIKPMEEIEEAPQFPFQIFEQPTIVEKTVVQPPTQIATNSTKDSSEIEPVKKEVDQTTIPVVHSKKEQTYHPLHEFHYTVAPVETPELKIEFVNAHSQERFTIVKLKITNKKNQYILYKSNETTFMYDFGNEHLSKGNVILTIEPNSTDTKSFTITGNRNYHVDHLMLDLKGFYLISSIANIASVPKFKIPSSKNDFIAEPFECFVLKVKQQSSETVVNFNCVYRGNEIGIINTSKITLEDKLNQKFKNDNGEDKHVLLESYEGSKFSAEFHVPTNLLNMGISTLNIVWADTFSEAKATPLQLGKVNFIVDSKKNR